MKKLLCLAIISVLVGCGVDGEPVAPQINGGVTINQNGIHPNASVGIGKGPLSIWLGL